MKHIILVLYCSFLAFAATAADNITLKDFKLVGNLTGEAAAFTLTATAHVEGRDSCALQLLAGPVALTGFDLRPKSHIHAADNQFYLTFDRGGDFPIKINFAAAVRHNDGWNSLDFHVAPSVLQQVVLRGLGADTQFQFAGAAKPDRRGSEFFSYLPADGSVKFSWKEARVETEGKLFFSAEMLSQIGVAPGLMRQNALLDFKVMQGELNRVSIRAHGAGEVTRVQGDQVLAWQMESITNSPDRLLVIQLNQPQKDQFSVQVQTQTPLGAFPQTVDILQLRPEKATRFAGYARVVNEGAVRLEITQSTGASQISPAQFPENDATHALAHGEGNQCFAYRFAGEDFALRIQADQILPEVDVSEALAYRVAESELTLDAELELDIREAPLRELLIRLPKGFTVSPPVAAGLNDYFVNDTTGEIRLVYGQPVSGRQLVQLHLEHNEGLAGATWSLPRLEVIQARNVHGYVGVAADAGLRITPEKTKSLTDVAPAFFPLKLDGIQAAFRLSDPAWDAALRVERLPQSVQAGALHLFSIGEGIAYGSSILNYVVSGTPVGTFKIELSSKYYNVEFTGKDLRNWQKTDAGYIVQLQTPVSGPYTLLATYERPFKAQGETLSFVGARPLDVQSEEGYTLVTSAYQFQVKPAGVSPGLLPLEPGEVPMAYRLFSDAPVLAAYRYAARPFDLKLALSPLAQGDSVSQIVDRASLDTHVAKEGQAVTEVRYFVKNRGNPNFRVTIPDGSELWSATINGASVVPVQDGAASLIPLPQSADPNAVLDVKLKIASQSSDAGNVRIAAPIPDAPVLLALWKVEPDAGQRLVYQSGTVRPESAGVPDVSGFGQIARMFTGENCSQAITWLMSALGLAACAVALWRWAARTGNYRTGLSIILGDFALIAICFVQLTAMAATARASLPVDLNFVAPVQQAGAGLTALVSNMPDKVSNHSWFVFAWPVLAAVVFWALQWGAWTRLAGWLLIVCAGLAFPNGATWALWLVFAFLFFHIALPASRQLWRWPRSSESSAAAPAAALIILGFLCLGLRASAESMPDSVIQSIRIEDQYAFATAKIHWQATNGQILPLLLKPAVLTHIDYSQHALQMEEGAPDSLWAEQLTAKSSGAYDIEFQYQIPISGPKAENGIALPVLFGLINQLDVTAIGLDVDVSSPQAVSTHCEQAGTNTIASLVLAPGPAKIAWLPRRRDVKHEKAVFYAEVTQLFVPEAGVIEGAHSISVRPAQGELTELILGIPPGATVTDVSCQDALVSLWRFDPDTRKLRVTFNRPQSRPFVIAVRSQISAGPLPFQQTTGLLTVFGATSQIGLAGIATGNEVQLDSVEPHSLSPINLEDFSADALSLLKNEVPNLTLHRAFRYSDTNASLSMRASAVQPDVRVESEDTLSLGEDRALLADTFTADITRAGIFDLSFVMPAGFDIESVSSPVLSQWTDLKSDAGRVVTLHLNGKTEGKQSFVLTLVGPGVKAAKEWKAPQVIVREASKQHGSLLIVPEQGMRLQVAAREGYSQLDPQKAGVREKGALGFRLLQEPASLSLNIEQVDPWIQVTSLQHAAVSDAQIKVTANLQYQIENTGLKGFRVRLPTNAANVRFDGEEASAFSQTSPGLWDIKLRRRFIGQYLLQANYQIPLPDRASEAVLRGVQALDVNLQRGFVTIQSDPRLQITLGSTPESLQPTEWQSIPRALEKNLRAPPANFAFRMVEPAFELALKLQRHDAARVLPAHVNNITFQSVVSDDGIMLTRTRLELVPGDKRLLGLTLPKDGRFWFAFVNDTGVWPWRDEGKILIPLEQQASTDKPVTVELFHSCRVGRADGRALDLSVVAPKFDLPLEDITWKVSLDNKWTVQHWTGDLQLALQEIAAPAAVGNPQAYLQIENTLQQVRNAQAQEIYNFANSSLQNGAPEQARRAFAQAFDLSSQDAAFNEDARVQLHNVKLQEALIGLNECQSAAAGDPGALGRKLRELRDRKEPNYSQQDAKDIIDINTADDNGAFMREAEKLIQQQDAAVNAPTGIRATIPDEGRVLTFKRSVAVDSWADLHLNLQAVMVRPFSLTSRLVVFASVFGILTVFGLLLRNRTGSVA